MADISLNLGATVEVDAAGGTTWTTLTNTISITPPDRVRTQIDATVLADTLAINYLGIEEHSNFAFRDLWDPTDANHIIMQTLFGNKAVANWRITYPFSSAITAIFLGQVNRLEVDEMTREGVLTRSVGINRRGAITQA